MKKIERVTWRSLNSTMATLTEEEVYKLLEQERWTLKRARIMCRLHQRYNSLRVAREREELLLEAEAP